MIRILIKLEESRNTEDFCEELDTSKKVLTALRNMVTEMEKYTGGCGTRDRVTKNTSVI